MNVAERLVDAYWCLGREGLRDGLTKLLDEVAAEARAEERKACIKQLVDYADSLFNRNLTAAHLTGDCADLLRSRK